MNAATAVRAGTARPPRHHVLPQQHRKWFEERGFVGEHDIDKYCIELTQGAHEAHHGGARVKLAGAVWPEGMWNTAIMGRLQDHEAELRRKLTRNEVLSIAREHMDRMKLGDYPFVPYDR